jgi:hypothetical protein
MVASGTLAASPIATQSVSHDKAILVGNGTHRRYCLSPAAQPLSIWPVSVARRPAKILYLPGPLPVIIGL